MLGTKIARMYPNTSVVTILPAMYQSVFKSHLLACLLAIGVIIVNNNCCFRSMIESLSLSNVLSFSQDLTPEMVISLHSMPDLFRFQVVYLFCGCSGCCQCLSSVCTVSWC